MIPGLDKHSMANFTPEKTGWLACIFACLVLALSGFAKANTCTVKPLVLPIFVSKDPSMSE
jgi:hypothetical protein